MSSIMRARNPLTGRWEGWEVIGAPLSSRRLLDLRCSGSDALTVTLYRLPFIKNARTVTRTPPARAGSLRAVSMDIPSRCPYARILDGEERTDDSTFRSRRARPRGDGRQSSPECGP